MADEARANGVQTSVKITPVDYADLLAGRCPAADRHDRISGPLGLEQHRQLELLIDTTLRATLSHRDNGIRSQQPLFAVVRRRLSQHCHRTVTALGYHKQAMNTDNLIPVSAPASALRSAV